MSFLAVLLALILEQARPLAPANRVHGGLRVWLRWSMRSLDAGRVHHGWLAWSAAVLLPALLAFAMYLFLYRINGVLAFAWNVAILYVTLGFRQFSHHFTHIRTALDDGDEAGARELLAAWRQVDSSDLPRSEIVRHVIEYSVLAAHRHVFGVLAWFSVLAALGLGPAGAVLYRAAEFAARYFAHTGQSANETDPASPALQSSARRAWGVIDYVPARVTSLGFAVVGSFEDAIDAWRHYAQHSSPLLDERNDGIILAATSGAVNVRLGGRLLASIASAQGMPGPSHPLARGEMATNPGGLPESTPGRAAEPMHLRSIVGLVWRSVVLWMVLLALLTLARLLG
jgi:adenosylcobinamide-phosphate synthase